MKKSKDQKNIVIVVLLVAVVFMSVGYAALASQLNINGTAAIKSNWDVKFTSISEGTAVGSATNKTPASTTVTTATFDVELVSPGDSMTYELVVKNNGSLDAKLDSITGIPTDLSGAIKYTVTGVAKDDTLSAGESKTITIKVEYDGNVTSQPSEDQLSKELNVTLNYVQA